MPHWVPEWIVHVIGRALCWIGRCNVTCRGRRGCWHAKYWPYR